MSKTLSGLKAGFRVQFVHFVSKENMADMIVNLPVDDTPEIPEDTKLLETFVMLEQQKENATRIFASTREILVATGLFLLLSIPPIDSLVAKIYPSSADSVYYRILIKGLIFLILLFVINNFSYVLKRRSSK